MLRGRRYSKKGDGTAMKEKIFQKGGRNCYEEDIPKRGMEMMQRTRYSKKGEGNAKRRIPRRRYSKKGDGNATKKIFHKGGRKC